MSHTCDVFVELDGAATAIPARSIELVRWEHTGGAWSPYFVLPDGSEAQGRIQRDGEETDEYWDRVTFCLYGCDPRQGGWSVRRGMTGRVDYDPSDSERVMRVEVRNLPWAADPTKRPLESVITDAYLTVGEASWRVPPMTSLVVDNPNKGVGPVAVEAGWWCSTMIELHGGGAS